MKTSIPRVSLVALTITALLLALASVAESRGTGHRYRRLHSVRQQTHASANALAPGTPITVRLDTSVDSRTAGIGRSVRGRVVSNVWADRDVVVPAGSVVHGSVASVRPARRFGGQALVSVRFDSITTPNGWSIPVDGTLTAVGKRQIGRDAATIAGSTVGGAIMGKVIGGDDHDAAVGAVVGGGIGTAMASRRGQEAFLPAGSQVIVHTLTTTTFRLGNS